ncbi:hypothetical protein PHEL49_1789 [Polaribacter sp. Hel1_33_49]|nr:hypothetical protein PHEL49_1789 [Polaribacter sp. Hel1_33_49]
MSIIIATFLNFIFVFILIIICFLNINPFSRACNPNYELKLILFFT